MVAALRSAATLLVHKCTGLLLVEFEDALPLSYSALRLCPPIASFLSQAQRQAPEGIVCNPPLWKGRALFGVLTLELFDTRPFHQGHRCQQFACGLLGCTVRA